MSHGHNHHKTGTTTRGPHPSTVHKKKKRKIKSNDPRNSQHAQQLLDEDFIVVEEDTTIIAKESVTLGDIFSEDFDPTAMVSDDDFVPIIAIPDNVMTISSQALLEAPVNLSVDPNAFQIEDSSAGSDGSVRFIASLYFDDVEGADSYDYVITAKG